MTLGLTDELVQQFGALDVQEVGLGLLRVVATGQRDLLRQRVGDGLGDERLATTGRTVEQHALRRPQLVVAEQILVQERQLDGVADLLDLSAETTDVLVPDIGHLFEDEVLDLGLGHPLEGESGFGVDEQRVARTQLAALAVLRVDLAQQRLGQPHDALLVGVADDQRPPAVPENLAQRADLADRVELAGLDDGQGLVQTQRLTLGEGFGVDVRRTGEPHLAAGGEHIDGRVGVHVEQDPVSTRRLTETVDLLAQGDELLTRLLEGVEQLRVACREAVDAFLEAVGVCLTSERRAFGTTPREWRGVGRGEALVGCTRALGDRTVPGGVMAVRFGHC